MKAEIYTLYPELVGIPNNTETLDLLIRYAMDIWNRLGESLLNRLVNIMEYRVKAVIEAEGWYIKY